MLVWSSLQGGGKFKRDAAIKHDQPWFSFLFHLSASINLSNIQSYKIRDSPRYWPVPPLLYIISNVSPTIAQHSNQDIY